VPKNKLREQERILKKIYPKEKVEKKPKNPFYSPIPPYRPLPPAIMKSNKNGRKG
jgi:hypothetical protein